MERSPASRLGIVAVDAEANRRDWYFGELIACSAGLSGAFAARGVKRGDVVMTLVGNRVEWVLTLLACWRMGAVALPCSTQLRRARPRASGRRREPDALRRRRGAAGRAAGRGAGDDPGRGRRGARRGPPAGDAGGDRGDGAGGPGADRLHLRHHRRAARRRPRLPLPVRPAAPGRALVRLAQGRAGLVHDGDRLVEVGPQRLPRPLADRRRRGHPRRPLRPGRAARLRRGARRQRPLPGADRVPDAGQARRPAPPPRPAPDGLRRRAARPGDDRRLPRGHRPRARRRLRPDRDRPRHRQPRRRAGAPGLDGQAAAGDRDAASCEGELAAARRLLPHLLQPLPRRRALRGRVVADRRPGPRRRATATSSSRAATTTSSSPPATGSAPSRSSRRCSPTPPSPRPPRSPPPTPSAARSCAPIVVPRDREPSEELARELQEHCKRETAPYKFPRIVEFVAELPKTSSGKIKRAQLRQG